MNGQIDDWTGRKLRLMTEEGRKEGRIGRVELEHGDEETDELNRSGPL